MGHPFKSQKTNPKSIFIGGEGAIYSPVLNFKKGGKIFYIQIMKIGEKKFKFGLEKAFEKGF